VRALDHAATASVLAELIQPDMDDDLNSAGYGLVRLAEIPAESEAPDWATALLDTLFTGKPLDFDGAEVPDWLQQRLHTEYGAPYPYRPPTGGVAQAPDLDDEGSPSLGSYLDARWEEPRL
jgi:hypothetical protein